MRSLPASHPDEDEDTDVNSYLSAQGRPGGREVGVGAGAEGLCVCVCGGRVAVGLVAPA